MENQIAALIRLIDYNKELFILLDSNYTQYYDPSDPKGWSKPLKKSELKLLMNSESNQYCLIDLTKSKFNPEGFIFDAEKIDCLHLKEEYLEKFREFRKNYKEELKFKE